MKKIIDYNSIEINKDDVSKTKDVLENFLNLENPLEIISRLLSMDDDNIKIIAPGILMSLEQQLNNPNDKLLLAYSLNTHGIKYEDMKQFFNNTLANINNLEGISQTKKDIISQFISIFNNVLEDGVPLSKRIIKIPIEFCNDDAKMPQYANVGDSGLDIYAIEDIVIHPGETKLIPTGIKVAIPLGYELQVRPKSGRSLKTKLRIANAPGTIDSGYRDQIGIIIENIEPAIKDITYESELIDGKPKLTITSILHGSDYFIGKGEKFAQLVLCEIPKATFFEVESVGKIEGNRGGGFGSTGVK